MAGTDNRQPWDDYRSLLQELELYNPEMLERPRLVVAALHEGMLRLAGGTLLAETREIVGELFGLKKNA